MLDIPASYCTFTPLLCGDFSALFGLRQGYVCTVSSATTWWCSACLPTSIVNLACGTIRNSCEVVMVDIRLWWWRMTNTAVSTKYIFYIRLDIRGFYRGWKLPWRDFSTSATCSVVLVKMKRCSLRETDHANKALEETCHIDMYYPIFAAPIRCWIVNLWQ